MSQPTPLTISTCPASGADRDNFSKHIFTSFLFIINDNVLWTWYKKDMYKSTLKITIHISSLIYKINKIILYLYLKDPHFPLLWMQFVQV